MDLSLKKNESTEIGKIPGTEVNSPILPEWHKQILEERSEKYISGKAPMKNWDDVQKDL